MGISEDTVMMSTLQPLVDTSSLASVIGINHAEADQHNGKLRVSFNDGTKAEYDSLSIFREIFERSRGIQVRDIQLPSRLPWAKVEMPTYTWDSLLDLHQRKVLCQDMLSKGVALVRGTPQEDGGL